MKIRIFATCVFALAFSLLVLFIVFEKVQAPTDPWLMPEDVTIEGSFNFVGETTDEYETQVEEPCIVMVPIECSFIDEADTWCDMGDDFWDRANDLIEKECVDKSP